MLWEPWAKKDWMGLARYVSPDVVQRLALSANRTDLLITQGHRALVREVYDELRKCGIRYAPEKYHPYEEAQEIRTGAEMLDAPHEGTCLDLAILFCGLCLGYGLLPLLVVVEGHALAAVSLRHTPTSVPPLIAPSSITSVMEC